MIILDTFGSSSFLNLGIVVPLFREYVVNPVSWGIPTYSGLIWETLCPLYILKEEAGYDNCDEDHHHAAVFTIILGIVIPLFWE